MKDLTDDYLDEVRDVAPESFVFLDEAGINIAMTPTHGRAPSGQRVIERREMTRAPNVSMLGFVRLGTRMQVEIKERAHNGATFLEWVKRVLVPHLREGDVVVMDNASIHKVRGVREAIRAVGAWLVYLPPYSPEFNPIEEGWSKVKHLLRKAKARSLDLLRAAVGDAVEAVSQQDLVGWFNHAGYRIGST